MKTKNRIFSAALIPLAALLGACEGDVSGSGNARLTVHLTDAPGDFVSAEVEIDEIYLQPGDDEDGERFVIYSGGDTFDLLDLRNGVTAELAEVLIPAGTYSQLRLVLGEATIETEDGRVFSTADNTLHCPSCAQSGLKIKLPSGGLRLDEGDQNVIIDFDVAQSFGKEAGRSGRWIMKPVISATRAELAGAITGAVTLASGVTLPACGGGAVTLAAFVPTASFGDLTLSATTNADGTFSFPYLAGATYTLGYSQEIVYGNGDKLIFTAAPSLASLLVGPGSTGTVNYVISAVSCQVAPPPQS